MNIAEAFLYAMCVVMAGVCGYLYIKMKND